MNDFDSDRNDVLERASKADVRYVINAGSDRNSNIKGLELSAQYPEVYSAVGIHPHDAKTVDDTLYSELRNWAQRGKVVAIGEIGLDYHYLHSPKGVQIDAFSRQISLAKELDLPIIVHSREAKKDTLRVLKEEIIDTPGVLHCFSGDKEMAMDAMAMGMYISIEIYTGRVPSH
jgi:TatD DNase family protein